MMTYNAQGLIRELVYHVNRCRPNHSMPKVEGYVAVYLPVTLVRQIEAEANSAAKFEEQCG